MSFFSTVKLFAQIAIALPLLLAGADIHAQELAPNKAPAAVQPSLADAQLKSFAQAYVAFNRIRAEYEPKLAAATTPQEKKLVQDEAVAMFDKAAQKEGLSLQEYGVIFHTVNADESLRERVLRLIEEAQVRS